MRNGLLPGWRNLFHRAESSSLAKLGLFGSGDFAAPLSGAANREGAFGDLVRSMIHESNIRGKYFESGLFGDPAWDMLLHLYEAHETGHASETWDLCAASNLSAMSVERWIKLLEARGLVKKTVGDGTQKPSRFVLSDAGRDAMRNYLTAVSHSG